MPVVRVVRPPMVTAEMYEAVNNELGVDGNVPDGLIAHAGGEVDGEWEIVEIWESAEHAERFDTERLTPAIEAVVGAEPPGEPKISLYEAHTVIVR